MPAKKKVSMIEFEGNIFGESEKSYYVNLEIPEKYSDMKFFPPKSVLGRSSIRNGVTDEDGFLKSGFITGTVPFWCFNKLDKELEGGVDKKEVNEIIAKQDMTKIFPNKEIEVITPALEEKHIETKENFNKFIGKGMEFKEISVSLGEKVSVNFQSKNAQVGAVISVGGESIDDVYKAARSFVKGKLKEEAIRIREEML